MTKKTWVLVGVFVLIALFGLFFIKQKQGITPEPVSDSVNLQPSSTPVATKKPSAVTQSQTYTQLVKEYEGRRIQFDINCQAVPASSAYRSGTKIMFDNRSGDARTITVGGVQYNLSGYGYKILTLSSQTLPKTVLLSCGAAVNVGQVLLQN